MLRPSETTNYPNHYFVMGLDGDYSREMCGKLLQDFGIDTIINLDNFPDFLRILVILLLNRAYDEISSIQRLPNEGKKYHISCRVNGISRDFQVYFLFYEDGDSPYQLTYHIMESSDDGEFENDGLVDSFLVNTSLIYFKLKSLIP